MRSKLFFTVLIFAVSFSPTPVASAKERKPEAAKGWGYVRSGPLEVRPSPSGRKRAILRLGRGTLVPVFETKPKGTMSWVQVQVVDPATLSARIGWVVAKEIDPLPADRYPKDSELLKQLGGVYLEDFTTAHTALARFLVSQGSRAPALVCYIGSIILSHTRLQVFHQIQEKLAPGPYLEFPFVEMQSGITALEIRDLIGDGNECLITREPFNLGPAHSGLNMVVRRIEDGVLRQLWSAPLEHRNLGSFPPRVQILEPPWNNIGAPGTVTTGTVDFRTRGNVSEPVWKGKVEFHAIGREEPVETITLERTCTWDGTKFTPLL